MEIDELKNRWDLQQAKYNKQELEDIFFIRTRRRLHFINKTMKWDMIVAAALTVAIISVAFLTDLNDKYAIASGTLFLLVVLAMHYKLKHLLLNNPLAKKEVGLYQHVQILLKRLNTYKITYIIGIPLFAAVLCVKLLHDLQGIFEAHWLYYLLVIPMAGIVATATYMLFNKLYGNEINKLRQIQNLLLSEDIG